MFSFKISNFKFATQKQKHNVQLTKMSIHISREQEKTYKNAYINK